MLGAEGRTIREEMNDESKEFADVSSLFQFCLNFNFNPYSSQLFQRLFHDKTLHRSINVVQQYPD